MTNWLNGSTQQYSEWKEPTPTPYEDLENLRLKYAEDHLAYVAGVAECIKKWFFTNYEDPAENTPVNDGEYIFQPDAFRTIISDAFEDLLPEADFEEILDAALHPIGLDECVPS